jgi:hypothetical protein
VIACFKPDLLCRKCLIRVSAGFLRIAADHFVMTPGSLHGSMIVVVLLRCAPAQRNSWLT